VKAISNIGKRSWWAGAIAIALLVGLMSPGYAAAPAGQAGYPPQSPPRYTRDMSALLADRMPVQPLKAQAFTPCVNGFAGIYPCNNIDLDAFLPLAQIGGGSGSNLWGWTDPLTDKEYAIMGRSTGTSFVDISDPVNPVYLGNLPTDAGSSSWREVNVDGNYAFIVCDLCGAHGMQVFDLTQLRNVDNPPVTFSDTARYLGFNTAHTVTINTETHFAYANGSNTCGGGPHMVDISDPLNPNFAGCNSIDGYTHDNQCVIYHGPDAEHQGREICFESNEDTLTIVDVTDKSNPTLISRTSYPGVGYTHQGWLTGNQRFFILDDELDELFSGHTTWTRFFDIRNLEAPAVRSIYRATTDAIDHNQYVIGKFVYQANYRAGLRILQIPRPTEVAFFDIYPADDAPDFNAAWGNYPFFASGTVIVSGIEQGLFILHPNLP
jgi:choice-of-anchor B domain-containing protein